MVDPTPSNILIPGLTSDESRNTVQFLERVCTVNAPSCKSLILKQSILKHNQYERRRNPDTGKLEFVYEDGKRILRGQAGKDWTKPAIYDLVTSIDLLNEHDYHYPHKVVEECAFWDDENKKCVKVTQEKYVHEPRPALIDAIINSDARTKYLFVPALIEPHKMMCRKKTSNGVSYRTQNNYSTKDVRYGRCLWVDIDGHDFPNEQIAWLNLMAVECLMQILPDYCAQTGVPMPAVVNSGRGVHLYWWLDTPVRIIEKAQQAQFKWLLNQLSSWSKKLIEQDQTCSDIWKTDSASSAIYHMMNLPGTIHPKTGARRYVVNTLGVDYHLYDYDSLCALFAEHEQEEKAAHAQVVVEQEQLSLFDPIVTTSAQIISNDESDPQTSPPETELYPAESLPTVDSTSVSVVENNPRSTLPANYIPNTVYNVRMNKLLKWAAGRNWDIYGHRRNWLLYMGILFQCGATCNLRNPNVYPLHDINALLLRPLDNEEVDEVTASLTAKAIHDTRYKICDGTIADNLEMTDDERTWYCAKGQYHGSDFQPRYDFKVKLREIMDTTSWDPEVECREQFIDRCHELTKQWLDENRFDKNRNSARSRRNKAKPGYNSKGGRPSKYTNEDRAKCFAFKESGICVVLQVHIHTVQKYPATAGGIDFGY